jgi:hypothetical protein
MVVTASREEISGVEDFSRLDVDDTSLVDVDVFWED